MEYSPEILHRLKRIEGQVKAVIRMMENGDDCHAVAPQLRAISNATDKTLAILVAKNLESCLLEHFEKNNEHSQNKIDEAIKLLINR